MAAVLGSMQIEIIKSIGKGNYGEVFLCQDQHGRQFALKAIRRNLMDDRFVNSYKTEVSALKQVQQHVNGERSEEELPKNNAKKQHQQHQQMHKKSNSFDQEMSFTQTQKKTLVDLNNQSEALFNHNSKVIQFIANLDVYSFTFSNAFYSCHAIFMEYARNGCLGQYIQSDKYTSIPVGIYRTLAYSLLQGIQEIHEAGLAHRDIKEDNVVFGDDFSLKLIDLSFAGRPESEVCGTLKYMAPELILLESGQTAVPSVASSSTAVTTEQDHFTRLTKLDTFAAGVVLFRLLTKKYPSTKASRFDHRYMYIYSTEYDRFWENTPFLIDQQTQQLQQQQNQCLLQQQQPDQQQQEQQNEQENLMPNQQLLINVTHPSDKLIIPPNDSTQDHEHKHHQPLWVSPLSCDTKGRRFHMLNQLAIPFKRPDHILDEEDDIEPQARDQTTLELSGQISTSSSSSSTTTITTNNHHPDELQLLKELIQGLLAYQPEDRLSLQHALEHPFFTHDQLNSRSAFASQSEVSAFLSSLLF